MVPAIHEPGSIPVSKQRVPLSSCTKKKVYRWRKGGTRKLLQARSPLLRERQGFYQADDITKVEIPDRPGEAETAIRLVFIFGGA